MNKIENRRNFIINITYYALIGLLFFVTVKYGIPYIFPFLVAFLLAFILKSPINWISNTFKINRKLTASFILLLFYGIFGTLLFLGGGRIFIFLKNVFYSLPDIYINDIEPALFILFHNIEILISKLDPSLVQGLKEFGDSFLSSLASGVTNLSTQAIGIISVFATSIPSFLINTLITIIASFFFTLDYSQITSLILKTFSPKISSLIIDIKNYVVGTLFKFAKAYGILMSITFIELSIGFSILGLDYAVIIALLIAMVDILPILGTGGVLIPWLIITFLTGNVNLSIGLGILYLFITIVRNILEPKIVGQQIGLHPIITLMCMFVGVKLLGFLGLFILPISVIILKSLKEAHRI